MDHQKVVAYSILDLFPLMRAFGEAWGEEAEVEMLSPPWWRCNLPFQVNFLEILSLFHRYPSHQIENVYDT